ncbi:MAG: uroporphyrinogen-III C-methyltransferase, partial [SAR202 cluster bacterium]|nr:uroporphyrinogen-III C-methyltransferase [SAR202 cluster bacterium]
MSGKVYLVGAGPGDPGLLTLKGQRLLASADVVLYDRLVNRKILMLAADDAEMINVGKVLGEMGRTQSHINSMLIEHAQQGKLVVRLQGGDPFVFGRGGEEAEDLREAQVPYEVVPGVTSVVAAPAYAGIPLTHRRLSSSFTVVTGNEDPRKSESSLDWKVLSQLSGTLVVLMGWRNLPGIVETLIANGKSPDTPAALVMWGTEPWQNSVTGNLANIVEHGRENGISSPVIAVVGAVACLRETLQWFDNRPLFGKRALITRTRAQASKLSQQLEALGAVTVEVPAIEIQPLDDYSELDRAIENLSNYDWILFSSGNGVETVFDRLRALNLDSRAFAGTLIACIGPATAYGLRAHGIDPDLIPKSAVADSLLETLTSPGVTGVKFLIPRADIGRDILSNGLSAAGATVSDIVAYRTATPESSKGLATDAIAEGIDIAVFTSSSTVENFSYLLNGDLSGLNDTTIA